MQWYKCGTATGTGTADLDIEIGFVPSKFSITNPVTGASIEWTTDMGDNSGIKKGGDSLQNSAACGIGSTPAYMATGAFTFKIDGFQYAKAAVTAGTAPTATTVTHSASKFLYAAFGYEIGVDGTIHAGVDASGNAAGYDTEAQAIAALLADSITAAHVLLGFFTVKVGKAADFVGATTDLASTANVVTYYDMCPLSGHGVKEMNDENGQGVYLGADPNVNVASAALYWEAWR
jgi:hypothetical protein